MKERPASSILYDEVLEFVFMKKEDGEAVTYDDLLRYDHFGHEFSVELLDEMVSKELIKRMDSGIELSEIGLLRARRIIRCHRLAERLLVDVLNIQDELIESNACRFEHILSEEIADSICTLLGHPRTCPHGREIPPGDCCRLAEKEVLAILKPLSQAAPGERGIVAYINSRFHERLSRLASLGLSPGQELVVRQVRPSFIINFGETELALEKDVASEIYIRVSNNHVKAQISRG